MTYRQHIWNKDPKVSYDPKQTMRSWRLVDVGNESKTVIITDGDRSAYIGWFDHPTDELRAQLTEIVHRHNVEIACTRERIEQVFEAIPYESRYESSLYDD